MSTERAREVAAAPDSRWPTYCNGSHRPPVPAAAGQRSRRPIGRFEPDRDVDEVPPLPGKVAPLPGGPRWRSGPAHFFPTTILRVNGTGARRANGFEPLGVAGVRALGLSAVRSKDLELQAAWMRVAGPAIVRRARVTRLRRGVLQLAISEPAWRRVIENLLPELGARFSRHYPELGVQRFSLTDARPAQ